MIHHGGATRRRLPPDAGLRSIVRGHLGTIGQWASIETGTTEQGVPDMFVCLSQLRQQGGGRNVWIECKRTQAWAVTFKPAQVGWLYTHWRHGGCAWIFTRRLFTRTNKSCDELYVTSAQFARELKTNGLRGVEHDYVGAGGPSKWDWAQVEEILRTCR